MEATAVVELCRYWKIITLKAVFTTLASKSMKEQALHTAKMKINIRVTVVLICLSKR